MIMAKSNTRPWSERQRSLIESLADITDTRSKEDRAKELGYSKNYVYQLHMRDDFIQAVRDRSRQLLGLNLPRVYAGLVKSAAGGDVKAAELLLKACGEIESGGAKQVVHVNQTAGDDLAARLSAGLTDRARTAPN